MENYRNSCSSLNNNRFTNTGPMYTMGSVATNLQRQQQQQQQHGPQLLMNNNTVGTATQFQFVPARQHHHHHHHQHATNTFQFDIGNSIGPIFNSIRTFFSNLLKPTIRMETTFASTVGNDMSTEKRKCSSAPNIFMDVKSDGKCADDLDESFVDAVDYDTLTKMSSSTKSFSDYNLPISAVKANSYCSSNRNIPESTDKVPDIISKSLEQQPKLPYQTTKESTVEKSPPPSPISPLQPKAKSISSLRVPTVPIMTRRSDKKRSVKEKSNRKAKRRSGKNQKEKGKQALALNIYEDCVTESETMSTDEWDEPLVIITSSTSTTPSSIQPSPDPVFFSTDDFPAMATHCPSTNTGIQTLPRLSHCVAALIGKRPQSQLSECDSEDSFIVFENDDKFTPSSVESNQSICDRIRSRLSMGGGSGRQRQISESSDDDFICFEMEESDADSDVDEYDGPDCDDDEPLTSVSDCESEVDVKSSGTNPPDSGFEDKKVRFNLKPAVHVLRTWSFAHQQARKGEWEQYARDRVRFCDRIKRLESTLVPILNADHRQKIYRDRFDTSAVVVVVGAIIDHP